MAAPVTLSTEAKNEGLDAITANLNSGSLKLYTGAAPASPDDAASGTLLATLAFNGTAFAAASSGVATANAVTSAAAVASGTAGYGRMTKSGGATGVVDLPAGGSQRVIVTNDGGDLLLTSLTAHGRSTGDAVEVFVESGGVLPTGLSANTTYYQENTGGLVSFWLHTLPALGSIVAYTDAGTAPMRVKNAATALALATKDAAVAEGVTVSVESLTLRF